MTPLGAAQSADQPVIGLAMIVRDAASTIIPCLESLWSHVDHVAILDTGSRDKTLTRVMEFAAAHRDEHGTGPVVHTGTFRWVDDFAAARRAAEEILPDAVTWTVWADADDIVRNAHTFHELAAAAPPDLAAYGFDYDYARDEHGNTVCRLRRERLVRRGAAVWNGRVHEAQTVTGRIEWMPPEAGQWVHCKPPTEGPSSSDRNLRILREWIKLEPTNTRLLAYLGTEEAGQGRAHRAIGYLKRYIAQDTVWPEERVQVHRKLALLFFDQAAVHQQNGRTVKANRAIERALQLALDALRVHPEWPDSYLTLAEAHYRLGEYQHAESWARRVLQLGAPTETLLIVNPLDYTFQPRLVLAGALGQQGRHAEAIQMADEALQLVPGDTRIVPAARVWRSRLKRDRTAAGVIAHARTLIVHDEQQKALALLEHAVPYFCVDHPEIVRLRSELRERLLIASDPAVYDAHYATGGDKPERLADDDQAVMLAAHLPRMGFLVGGLTEQAA